MNFSVVVRSDKWSGLERSSTSDRAARWSISPISADFLERLTPMSNVVPTQHHNDRHTFISSLSSSGNVPEPILRPTDGRSAVNDHGKLI